MSSGSTIYGNIPYHNTTLELKRIVYQVSSVHRKSRLEETNNQENMMHGVSKKVKEGKSNLQ